MKKSIFYYFFKRLFDLLSSFLLFVVISPFYLVIFIICLIDTKGAPFYIDHRVGKNGKDLKLFKFRSMYKDADTHPEKYLNEQQLDQWRVNRKVKDDPRITKFGRFIRRTSIDELPQLINIFIGNMSVVGPRPIVEREFEINYTKEQREIFVSAKPGLISNWGVYGRIHIDYSNGERQRLELEYFEKRSLLYDLKLIFLAGYYVLARKDGSKVQK